MEEFRSSITPVLTVRDAAQAIVFYGRAFGAGEIYRNTYPDGRIVAEAWALARGDRQNERQADSRWDGTHVRSSARLVGAQNTRICMPSSATFGGADLRQNGGYRGSSLQDRDGL